MPEQKFTRRIFTATLLFNDFGFLFKNFKNIRRVSKNKKISKAFFEKIMTIVSTVNGCVYCQWFHAKKSIASGISSNEVKNMLNLQFQ
ncbi:MAG: carboxymuconolactone decarboxylase family protein [Bacteroidales bacterium]|nr:carboxymuconolactone decarboxylase family protein [Bacteroidales bacterium]